MLSIPTEVCSLPLFPEFLFTSESTDISFEPSAIDFFAQAQILKMVSLYPLQLHQILTPHFLNAVTNLVEL